MSISCIYRTNCVRLLRGLLFLLLPAAFQAPVQAHEIRPAIVTIGLEQAAYNVTISLNIEALLAGIGPEHNDSNDAPEAQTYNTLRKLDAASLSARFNEYAARWQQGIVLEFDRARATPTVQTVTVPAVGDTGLARISIVRLTGPLPGPPRELQWTYLRDYGASILRIKRDGQPVIEAGWLKDGQPSGRVGLTPQAMPSKLRQVFSYMKLGFIHIVPQGLDHILFVVGLYLLSTSWRPLLIQVTAFTVAHSITLALGLYGVVTVSPRIVEPLIALSIAYVAIENIATARLQPWRPFVVFAFGLLHGLGFAGILQELDLPRGDYVAGLIGFNIGVELAQLTVILLAWLLSGYWFSTYAWYRRRIVWPASAAIAAIGIFWTVERIWFA